jgi:cytochrome c553
MRKLACALAFSVACIKAQAEDRNDFFETKIRPLLIARCASCHGDKVQMAGVQLTSKDGLHRSGVIVPGDPGASRIVQAVRHTSKIKMPPDAKLSDQEIRAIERWVADGAIWPEASGIIPVANATTHWAFKPVKRPEAPGVKDCEWPRSAIDRFILAKLEEKKLPPVPDAGKYPLLRRVTLDLTGLLPTVDEITAFEKDSSPQAFERVVDRLLASPAYGERWGRHWLDVTYWADTTGSGRRIPLRDAWRYRDYVIQAFNEDKPYDRFIREQIAGPAGTSSDEKAPPPTPEEQAATGFLVLGPWAWISYDREQLRVDVTDQQVDLVGRTFLGMTLGCARCHDHKFDPISNHDYFAMSGIFLSTKTLSESNTDGGINTVRLPETLESVKRYATELEAWTGKVAEVEAAEKVNVEEQQQLRKEIAALKEKPITAEIEAEIKKIEDRLASVKKRSGIADDRQILPFTKYMRPRLPEVYAVEDMDFPQDARVTLRGDAHQLGESVPRGFLSAVMYGPAPEIDRRSSGRKDLAEWIANDKNPLTARVYVNRIWHHLFGDGIVRTTENFGTRGELPTHPELLDHLAVRLVENGWSTKKLIREIVLSHVYQLASTQDEKGNGIDPDNRLLWRANRRRLEAEEIRDTLLQVSGLLDPGRGGPSLPLTAQNVHTIAPFFLEEDSIIADDVRNRRTIYQPIFRGGQLTDIDILNLFDFADPDQVVGTRAQTVVPTQTLYLLNSPDIQKAARALAEATIKDSTLDDDRRVSKIILAALSRPAEESERQQARQFISDFGAAVSRFRKESNPALEAWTRYCHAILVSSEFLYRR